MCCAAYGQGNGQIHMTEVECTGYELSLMKCSHIRSQNNCSHGEDASVECQTGVTESL